MRRLLITGESGFVGRHIVAMREELSEKHNLDLVIPQKRYNLLDPKSLVRMLSDVLPDAVIHLAGISFVPDSFRDPQRTFEVNLIGTLQILQALKSGGFSGSFLYVSSGDVYGRLSIDDLPATEDYLPRPMNPYAVSKVSAEALCFQWAHTESFERLVIARPFNHIGTGQREEFVIPSIAKQIIQIKQGLQEPFLLAGDIDVTRDFLDVKDVIHAYFELLWTGENGETYNVCSGCEQSIRGLIEIMIEEAGIDAKIKSDLMRFRTAEQRRSRGNNKKLVTTTGWNPTIPLKTSLKDVLKEWESKIHE